MKLGEFKEWAKDLPDDMQLCVGSIDHAYRKVFCSRQPSKPDPDHPSTFHEVTPAELKAKRGLVNIIVFE